MPPDDPTPLGDAMTHRFPEQKIPQPKPGASEPPQRDDEAREPDIEKRPPLPEHARPGQQRG